VSRESVEVVRKLVAALNEADVDAMVADFYTHEAEFIPAVQAALEGTVYRGSDEIRAYYEEIYAVWDRLQVNLEDLRDVGDTVFAAGSLMLRGKASGVELVRPWAFVFRLAGGKICWQRNFTDRGDALKAVGLEE
jgi:ketosteroid isomerase-like protein